MDFRPILFVTGALLTILSIGMTLPMFVDMVYGHEDWKIFFLCIAITAFFGGCLVLTNASSTGFELNVRQAFVLTTLSWLVMAIFGALPILFSSNSLSITDAFFESMSAITTTGATVLTNLDTMPPGLLLWRSMLQWLGGIGFILMAILILPFLKVGGMQLFRTESSDKYDKALPRLQRLGIMTSLVYLILTAVCALLYWIAGMTGFDSINHAMTTVATAGFSTHDASLGFFEKPAIHWIATLFMIAGALPFILYVRAFAGNASAIFSNTQVRDFFILVLSATLILAWWLAFNMILPVPEALRHAALNVTSIITTTGFASTDYSQWGAFPVAVFFILMFIGGCTGSTSGGIKIMRHQVMWQILNRHLKKLQQPSAVWPLRYENRTISDEVAYSVMVFIFTFLLCLAGLSAGLAFCGLDLVTSITGATSALTNVGPGLGDIIGPSGNFSTLPDNAKWLLSFGMLLGRLEIFTVLVLLMPYFWRR